jgi:hypothetical protein
MDRLNRLRHWVKVYIRTINPTLAVLFVVSLVVIIAYKIVFAGSPELFSGAAAWWDLLYELCLAVAASFIFYFVVVHAKRQQDKEALRPFLYRHTMRIWGDADAISRALKQASGHDLESDFPPSQEDTERMCASVNATDNAPEFMGTWTDFLADRMQRTRENSRRIYTVTPFLESEHLQRVMDVENCPYFGALRMAIQFRSAQDFSWMANLFHDYFSKAEQLRKYAHSNLTLGGTDVPSG